jgi:hypothetical protein
MPKKPKPCLKKEACGIWQFSYRCLFFPFVVLVLVLALVVSGADRGTVDRREG